jgi:outer membrane protein TolC
MTPLWLLLALAAAPAGAPAPERITFDEAVRRALARAPAARIAADEIARVDGLLWQARSASLPQVGLTASATRIDAERVLGSGPAARVAAFETTRQLQGTATVPLVAPGRWATWVVGAKQLDLTRISEQDVRRQVALAAGRAYLGVLASRRASEVSRSAVELARARLDFSRARLKAGVGNALDDARAEQVQAASEVQLESALTALARAREALGIATGAEAPLDAAEDPVLAAPAEGAGGVDGRPDVASARARLEAAAAAARYSWADWLPSLLLNAQETNVSPAAAPTPHLGWQVQLVVSLPILEGGLRVGQLRERNAIEREARTQLDATLRQARSDVRVAVEAIQHQEAAFSAARRAAESARQVLTLSSRAYEAGATNSLDLSTAQQQSRDADLAMVIAEDAVRQARLDLLAAVGLFP